MKILAVILSFYVLGLAAIRCADGEISHVKEQTLVSETIFFDGSHNHTSDACTPFCSCQCCHVQVTALVFPILETLNFEFHNNPISYSNNSGKEFFNPLFHPPIV